MPYSEVGGLPGRFETAEEAFHACIRDRNHLRLAWLLDTFSLDINYCVFSFGPPLHFAASQGDMVSVGLLLVAGADPRILSLSHHLNLMMKAAVSGRRDIIEHLWITKDPERNVQGLRVEQQPLFLAAKEGHAALVEDLLSLWDGWSEDARDQTFLVATRERRLSVVAALLRWFVFKQPIVQDAIHNAFMYKPPSDYHIQPRRQHIENIRQHSLLNILFNHVANPDVHMFKGMPIICYAARHARVDLTLKILLENGADPNQANAEGRTALHVLTKELDAGEVGSRYGERRFAIHLLLQYGASIIQRDNSGETPLHLAAYGSSFHLFRLYLLFYSTLHSTQDPKRILQMENHYGETLLHFASAACRIETMKFLIAEGLDVNAVNSNGWTPLMCALVPLARLRYPSGAEGPSMLEMVQATLLLLSHGAGCTTTTDEGWTPLHGLALHRSHMELAFDLATELLSRGVDTEARAIMLDLHPRTLSPVRGLLWHVHLPQVLARPSSQGMPFRPDLKAIHWAAQRGAVGVIRAMLRHNIGLSPVVKRTCVRMAVTSRFISNDQTLIDTIVEMFEPENEVVTESSN